MQVIITRAGDAHIKVGDVIDYDAYFRVRMYIIEQGGEPPEYEPAPSTSFWYGGPNYRLRFTIPTHDRWWLSNRATYGKNHWEVPKTYPKPWWWMLSGTNNFWRPKPWMPWSRGKGDLWMNVYGRHRG